MLQLFLLGAQPLVQLEVTAVSSFQHTPEELRQSRPPTPRARVRGIAQTGVRSSGGGWTLCAAAESVRVSPAFQEKGGKDG